MSANKKKKFDLKNSMVEGNGLLYVSGFFVLALIVFVAISLVPYYLNLSPNGRSYDPENWGQFGDYFGGVLNPIIAFFALCAIFLTLYMQRIELREAKAEFAKMSEGTYRQSFENTFFNLINTYDKLASRLEVSQFGYEKDGAFYIVNDSNRAEAHMNGFRGKKTLFKGEKTFPVFFAILNDELHEKYLFHDGSTVKVDSINEVYDLFYKKYGEELGGYYRLLYRIMKFVHESQMPDKGEYMDILRAQFSDYELGLLHLNSLSDKGSNFRSYMQEYDIRDNMTKDVKNALGDFLIGE